MPSNQTRPFYPSLAVLIGAILWGVVWYPMRLLEEQGLGGLWLTFAIYTAALLATLPYTVRSIRQLGRAPVWLAVLTLSAGWTNIAFVEAVLGGNILRVLLLFYLSPFWATVMGRLLLGERITGKAFASLAVAGAGAIVMLWNPAAGWPWPQSEADWFALSSGFAFALSNISTRGTQDVSIGAKVFCVWMGVTALSAAMIAVFAMPQPQVTTPTLAGAIALGGIGIAAMTLLIQYGVTHLPVYRSAVITFIELLAGAVSQALLTNETVGAREWIGGAMIVVGAYVSARTSAAES